MFPHTRKPLHRWRLLLADNGSFRAMEESIASEVPRAMQRDSCIED